MSPPRQTTRSASRNCSRSRSASSRFPAGTCVPSWRRAARRWSRAVRRSGVAQKRMPGLSRLQRHQTVGVVVRTSSSRGRALRRFALDRLHHGGRAAVHVAGRSRPRASSGLGSTKISRTARAGAVERSSSPPALDQRHLVRGRPSSEASRLPECPMPPSPTVLGETRQILIGLPSPHPSQRRAAEGRRSGAAAGALRSRPGSQRRAASLPPSVARKRRWAAARASEPASTTAIRGTALARHELDLRREPVAGDQPRVVGAGPLEALPPGGVADVPDDRLRHVVEAPAGDPRPHVEVDVLVEGEVALVVAAELVEQLAAQQAGGAADAEDLAPRQAAPAAAPPRRPARSRGRPRSAPGRRCRGGPRRPVAAPLGVRLRAAGCAAARRRASGSASQRVEQAAGAPRLEHRVGVEHQDRRRRRPGHAEVDRGGEAGVAGQRDVGHALALQVGHRAVARSRCRPPAARPRPPGRAASRGSGAAAPASSSWG